MIVGQVVVARLSANQLAKEGYHGLLRCRACGHEQREDPFACLRMGWPEHCGSTMELVKEDSDVR
jgi:hypothetical protein